MRGKTETFICPVCHCTASNAEGSSCLNCRYPFFSLEHNKKRVLKEVMRYQADKGYQTETIWVGQNYAMGTFHGQTINWKALEVQDDKVLLISEEGLAVKQFHSGILAFFVTWERSTLRYWLNEVFYLSAFSEEEREKILLTDVEADENPKHKTYIGSDTQDHIFLLGCNEAGKYFDGDEGKAAPGETAAEQGAYTDSSGQFCIWWLRTPGDGRKKITVMNEIGSIDYSGEETDVQDICVRPAMWVSIRNEDPVVEESASESDPETDSELKEEPDPKTETTENNGTDGQEEQTASEESDGETSIPLYLSAGNLLQMGSYSKVPVVWRVLAVENEYALLITEKGLDAGAYHFIPKPVSWERAELRGWLNSTFYECTFADYEKRRICIADLTYPVSAVPKPDSDAWLMDRIFLLSTQEAEMYFKGDEDRCADPTVYAKKCGASTGFVSGKCIWWLRTSGLMGICAACVKTSGQIDSGGKLVTGRDVCIRPAMWIRMR